MRRFRLRLSHGRRPRPAVRRALGLWGVLGGARLQTPSPLPPGAGAGGALLRGPNFVSSLRRTLGGRRAARPPRRRPRRRLGYRPLHRPAGDTGATPRPPVLGLGERLLRPVFHPRPRLPGAPALRGALLGGGRLGGGRAPGG
jgi:hypothetical protein